jgi:hypothetical protein
LAFRPSAPRVEKIIGVMRAAGDGVHGQRIRALPWLGAVTSRSRGLPWGPIASGHLGRALNALRTRAGTIIAAVSISGSFLGAEVSHGSLDAWAVLALIAFVLCLGCAIWGAASPFAGVRLPR